MAIALDAPQGLLKKIEVNRLLTNRSFEFSYPGLSLGKLRRRIFRQ